MFKRPSPITAKRCHMQTSLGTLASRPSRTIPSSFSHSYSSLSSEATPLSRQEKLREALEKGPSLDHFVQGSVDSPSASSDMEPEGAPKPKASPSTRRKLRTEPLPGWLKTNLVPSGETFRDLKKTVKGLGLATVCEEAKCPNIGECWSGGTATIMLMGDTCTRGCRFCAVKTSKAPAPLDPQEPEHVAEAISKWGLDYVVLTSVDRDDLPDGGAAHFARTVQHLKQHKPEILVECLTPDFQGDEACIRQVVTSGLDVFAHNIETVEELTPYVRDRRAKYRQSLSVLRFAKEVKPSVVTKSSIMLGLGEREDEVEQALKDLLDVGVEIVTFGQYLQPTKKHLKVTKYLSPEEFDYWRVKGEGMGFKYVASGPFVRSSYRAGEFFTKAMLEARRAQ